MKKLFGLSLVIGLSIACNTVSAKSNNHDEASNSNLTDPQTEQKTTEIQEEKPTKYDFSLFKFIASPVLDEKNDSTNTNQKGETGAIKDETVYEKPLAFFKFSYAS